MKFDNYKILMALLFFIGFGFGVYILFQQSHLPQFDSYYHSAMSERVFEKDFYSQSFPWLQETILKDNFSNMHFLFHFLLFPFSYFGFLGIKIFTAALLGVFLSLFYIILKKYSYEYAFIGTFLLLTSSDFFLRISLPRAISLNLILLFIGLYLLLERKYKYLFPLGFIYAWTYTGFVFLAVLCLAYYFVSLNNNKNEYLVILYSFLGIISGLIINPYFPSNFYIYFIQIFEISLNSSVIGGVEWLPVNIEFFLFSNFLILMLYVYAILFYDKKNETYQFLLLSSLLFACLTLISRRSIEIFAPLACAFIVYSYSSMKFSVKNKKFFKPIIIVFILFAVLNSLFYVSSTIYSSNNHLISDCADYLEENTQEKEVIFNAKWDDFPALFYYNTNNYYISGLDPNFMYLNNLDKFNLYQEIIYENASLQRIKEFNSSYIVSLKKNSKDNILYKSETDNNTNLVFQTPYCYVLQVK